MVPFLEWICVSVCVCVWLCCCCLVAVGSVIVCIVVTATPLGSDWLAAAPTLRILTLNDDVHVGGGYHAVRHRHLADVAAGIVRPHVVQQQRVLVGPGRIGRQVAVLAAPVELGAWKIEKSACVRCEDQDVTLLVGCCTIPGQQPAPT